MTETIFVQAAQNVQAVQSPTCLLPRDAGEETGSLNGAQRLNDLNYLNLQIISLPRISPGNDCRLFDIFFLYRKYPVCARPGLLKSGFQAT